MNVKLKVTGAMACFTRPEMSVERVSYPCMTPTAAIGVLHAIYAKPKEFTWDVKRILVHRPIGTYTLRLNEVKHAVTEDTMWNFDVESRRTQRYAVVLTDVAYTIVAGITLRGSSTPRNNINKHAAIFTKRVNVGACFYRPFLGMRNFPAYFGAADTVEKPMPIDMDMGWMPRTIDYTCSGAAGASTLFPAKLVRGVLHVPVTEVLR